MPRPALTEARRCPPRGTGPRDADTACTHADGHRRATPEVVHAAARAAGRDRGGGCSRSRRRLLGAVRPPPSGTVPSPLGCTDGTLPRGTRPAEALKTCGLERCEHRPAGPAAVSPRVRALSWTGGQRPGSRAGHRPRPRGERTRQRPWRHAPEAPREEQGKWRESVPGRRG